MRAALAVGLLLATTLPAADELPKEVLLLARIKLKVRQTMAQMPDYTCLETIERYVSPALNRPLKLTDTVRLEVGQVEKKEVFSWPGARRFEERDATALVGSGTVSTGEFVQLLRAVFSEAAVITWHGEESWSGRRVLRYDYRLGLFVFRTHVGLGEKQGDVSEAGSFWADADSLELLRLDAHAGDIPPDLPLVSMSSLIDYGRFRIRGEDVSLPQSAEVVVITLAGRQSRNRIEFSHCRQYAGESAISFDEPAPGAGGAASAAKVDIEIPAGLTVPLELRTEIDSSKASVGDPIECVLRSDVSDKDRLVLPKGAVVRGRIRQMGRAQTPNANFIVGVELSEVEFGNTQARFFGSLRSLDPLAGMSTLLSISKSGTTNFEFLRHEVVAGVNYYPERLPGVGTFFMSGARFRIPAGFKMVWETEATPHQ